MYNIALLAPGRPDPRNPRRPLPLNAAMLEPMRPPSRSLWRAGIQKWRTPSRARSTRTHSRSVRTRKPRLL
eukprot:15069712-Heterocapsa_arctica.AAC.1